MTEATILFSLPQSKAAWHVARLIHAVGAEAADPYGPVDPNEVSCRERLGGVIKHYYRRAA
jgi:hypothetical protein